MEVVWEIAKAFVVFVIVPLVAYLYKRHDTKLEELERRLSLQESELKVMVERVDNIKQDLVEIKVMLQQLLSRVKRG